MGQPAYAELRREPRLRLQDRRLPGQLKRTSGELVFAMAVDVSRSGLGISCSESLEPGTRVCFQTDDEVHDLEVIWLKKSQRQGEGLTYRVGLKAVADTTDLSAIFFAAGCVDYDFDVIE